MTVSVSLGQIGKYLLDFAMLASRKYRLQDKVALLRLLMNG